MTQTQTTWRYIFNACHRTLGLGNERRYCYYYWNPYTLTQLTCVYRLTHLARVCVCVYPHTCTSASKAFRNLRPITFQMSIALQGELQLEDTASSYKDFIPVNQGRNPEKSHYGDFLGSKHMLLTSCGAVCPYPLFSLIQNGFLLITIIPKVLKHINRWVSPAYKGPAGWLLWPCPTAADTSFSDKSNLAVTRGLASLKKYWGWSGILKSANAPLPYCCKDYSAVIFGCLQPSRTFSTLAPHTIWWWSWWWQWQQQFNPWIKNTGNNHTWKLTK